VNSFDNNITQLNKQASVELLRSIAMLMIITMHYLDKGDVLISLDLPQTLMSILGWLLHSFCIVAVNCYVLISGYFMLGTEFRWQKLLRLVLQILFYSLLVPLVMVCLGLLDPSDVTLYKIILYVFPIQTKHYWFATSYVLLYILSPVLSAGVKNMSKKSLEITIGISLLILSVAKTVLPFQMDLDEYGYNLTWFIVLFLVAAYLRLYGCKVISDSKRGLLIYFFGSLLTFGLAFMIRAASLYFDKFGYFVTRTFDYNHIVCFLSSVGLFLCFIYWKMPENWISQMAIGVGPYTFGVYLLHEQWEMRHVWPRLLKTEKYAGTPMGIIHWIISILVVFVVGILVDYIRTKLFLLVGKLFAKKEKN